MLETVNAVEAINASNSSGGTGGDVSTDEEDEDFLRDTDQYFEDEDTEDVDDWMSLDAARRLLGLIYYEPNEVFEEFALQADSQGLLSRESFEQCFFSLMTRTNHLTTATDQNRAHHIIDMLYDAFDTDQNDVIDFSELTAGLSILCGGTSGMRTSAALTLRVSWTGRRLTRLFSTNRMALPARLWCGDLPCGANRDIRRPAGGAPYSWSSSLSWIGSSLPF